MIDPLLAVLTTKIMNDAYAEVRRTVPDDEWREMTRDQKVELCTQTIRELFLLHGADATKSN